MKLFWKKAWIYRYSLAAGFFYGEAFTSVLLVFWFAYYRLGIWMAGFLCAALVFLAIGLKFEKFVDIDQISKEEHLLRQER